jgi:hypothetical protein
MVVVTIGATAAVGAEVVVVTGLELVVTPPTVFELVTVVVFTRGCDVVVGVLTTAWVVVVETVGAAGALVVGADVVVVTGGKVVVTLPTVVDVVTVVTVTVGWEVVGGVLTTT